MPLNINIPRYLSHVAYLPTFVLISLSAITFPFGTPPRYFFIQPQRAVHL